MARTSAANVFSRPIRPLTVWLLFSFCLAINAHAQTTTYHLHQEASTTSGLLQLKPAATDAATLSLSSINIKNKTAGEYIIKAFDTPIGVPGSSGAIPSGSTVTFSIWMSKTSSSGVQYPRAKLYLNSATGTILCTATGTTALTNTLTKYTFSATTSANVSMAATDRLYLWVGVNVTTKATADTFATLSVEGAADGNYDSSVVVPNPLPPPSITSLSPTVGPIGNSVTITGSNFGATQGSSSVTFNGIAAAASNWSPTSISVFVPTGATSGPVVVNVGGAASNSLPFTTIPQITSLSPNSGLVGNVVTIGGSSFGATQGTSTVKFNGITATPTSWNSTTIVTPVPAGTVTGPVIVTVGTETSNAVVFNVSPPVQPETLTVYLHKEASSTSGRLQLKLTAGDAAAFALQSADLRGLPTNADYPIKEFDTQVNVPNSPGVIPAGSPIKFKLWMKKTADFGEFYPKIKLTLNGGATICECNNRASGVANWITLSLFDYVFTCYTQSEITMTASDRLYLWVGVYAYPPASNSVRAELYIEQTRESNFVMPMPVPRPFISSLSPNGGSITSIVTIDGSNFGSSQGANIVTFNGLVASPLSWSNTQIVASVPVGATTGPVVVTVRNVPSNSVTYSVAAGTIAGTVTRVLDGSPINGAFVEAIQAGTYLGATRTNATGAYSIGGLAPGTYEVRVSEDQYSDEVQTGIVVTEGLTTTVNAALYKWGSIGGRITKPDGTTAIAGAIAKAYQNNQVIGNAVSDNNGNYSINQIRPGTSTIQVVAAGYQVKTQTGISVNEQANTTLDLSLDPASAANSIKYNYDDVGRLTTVENGAGQVARYSYDSVGNLLKITRHDSTQVSVLQFTPATGSASTVVTIYGTGFSAVPSENTVTFNGVSATVNSATTSQLVATAPAGVTTGPISVTSPTGSATSDTSFVVETNRPTITAFSPNIGEAGATVSVNGTNFETTPGKNAVTLGISRAAVTTATTSNLNITVPFGSSGKIRVTTPSGTAESSQDFFYLPTGLTAAQVGYTARMALGETKVVSIDTPDKVAMVVFDGVAGSRIGVTVTNALNPIPRNLNFVTYNPDGSSLPCFGGSISSPNSLFVTGVGRANVFPCYPDTLTFTGTYTILITPSSGATGNVTLTLSELPPPPTYEISPGGPTKTISVPAPGQHALVTFRAYAGERISLRLANATVDGFLKVYGPDWVNIRDIWISTDNNNPNTRFIDTLTLPTGGIHTFMVKLDGTGTRSVDLTLHDVPADIVNTIIADGPPVTANITVPGQEALFNFTGTASQRISLDLTNINNYSNYYLYDPVGTPVWSSGVGGFVEPLTLAMTGTYKLRFDGNVFTGPITARLYNVPNDASGIVTVNGSTSNLTTTPGQNANVTFSGTAAQLVTVRVTGNSMNTVTVTLLDANNSTLTSTTSSANNFNLAQKTLPANGTYRIKVDPNGSNAGNISVSVTSP